MTLLCAFNVLFISNCLKGDTIVMYNLLSLALEERYMAWLHCCISLCSAI